MIHETMAFSKQAKPADENLSCSSIQGCISASFVANNDDLLTEILLLLPIKSLLKFKSVSKHWLSLISNPTFSHRCTPYPATASALFFRGSQLLGDSLYHFLDLNPNPNPIVPSNAHAPFRSLSSLLNHSNARITQSCNGLLLCCLPESQAYQNRYLVLNPTTKQYSVLPLIESAQEENDSVLAMTLAFDPSKSPHYKVVCIRSCNFPILVYSSDNGPWRASSSFLPDTEEFDVFNDGVFWNGAVHWVCSWGKCFYLKLDDEQLQELPMPPLPDGWYERFFWYFGESRDHLHLIETTGPRFIEFDVYELERDHSGWFVKYHVDLDSLPLFPDIYLRDPEQNCSWSILSIIRSEIDEDSYLVLHMTGKIVRYNFQNKYLDKLRHTLPDSQDDGNEDAAEFQIHHAHQYIESLYCV